MISKSSAAVSMMLLSIICILHASAHCGLGYHHHHPDGWSVHDYIFERKDSNPPIHYGEAQRHNGENRRSRYGSSVNHSYNMKTDGSIPGLRQKNFQNHYGIQSGDSSFTNIKGEYFDDEDNASVISILLQLLPFVEKKQGGKATNHKKLIQALIKATKINQVLQVMDGYLKPLSPLVLSLLSCAFISVIPIVFIYLINLTFLRDQGAKDTVIIYGISFAIGGLLGDVFFHSLPELRMSLEESNCRNHLQEDEIDCSQEEAQLNFIIVLGIIGFFLVEKMTHHFLQFGKQNHDSDNSQKGCPSNLSKSEQEQQDEKTMRYKSFAIISMIGDFIHNFTDGLSIGVAYQANYKLGLTTTVAMFFHEIPHEIGDFAMLFQLRYNLCQILGLQFLTSVGAFIGTMVGCYLGNIYMQECLAFTSGGFLYFAINGLMGELKDVNNIYQLKNCILFIMLGLYSMYIFGLFE